MKIVQPYPVDPTYPTYKVKKQDTETMADREIIRNEIKCLLKIAADVDKEDRQIIRNIIIKLLEAYLL